MKKIKNGVWPTMITPFTADNKIDWYGVDKLTEWYIEAGVTGLFTVCLSSEIFHLTEDERLKLAEHVVKKVNGRIQTVSGILVNTDKDFEKIKHVYDKGVDAVVLLSGQLFKQDEKTASSYSRLDQLISITKNIPLGIYESPMPYHKVLNPKELKVVLSTNRFYFMKDTSCDIGLIAKKLDVSLKTDCCFFNANTPTLLESLKLEASGYSGIASNFYPELYVWLCNNFRKNEKLSEEISDFITVSDSLIHNKYPVSAKVFLKVNGIEISALSRSSNHILTNTEIKSLESLKRTVENQKIKFSKNL